MSEKKEKPECVCCFLVNNPYACKKCWPDNGSAAELKTFFDEVNAAFMELTEKERNE